MTESSILDKIEIKTESDTDKVLRLSFPTKAFLLKLDFEYVSFCPKKISKD